MTALRNLIVTGATGKQGGALISALLKQQSHPFQIFAVTRDVNSAGSVSLAAKANVEVIEGNFDNPTDIFKKVDKPWGLFLMTMPMNAKEEEAQGKAIAKAAVEAGVQHIVFTATDRGGPNNSNTDPTNVPHFASKYNIEQEIISLAEASAQQTTWTFLRPVGFFENISPGFLGKAFISLWRLNGPNSEMQFISTTDIGVVAADAFINTDAEEYRNKAISLSGDELTPSSAARVFKEVTGEEIPATYGAVGSVLRFLLKEQLGLMLDWIRDVKFQADIEGLRRRYPGLKDFGTWLREESPWKK